MRRKLKRTISSFTALALVLSSFSVMPEMSLQTCAVDDISHIQPVDVNEHTFPDPLFRDYVERAFDKDRNGNLDQQEILEARNIHVEDMGVTDLTGMEYLVELRGLYCQNSLASNQINRITSIDISKNQEITGVWCSNNPIGSIDITQNPTLEWIYCFNCGLTELDLTKSPLMSYVECNDNDLRELDVSKNPLLEHLICNYCELTELDLSHNPNMQHLDAIGNKFTKLDLSVCPKMKRLDIWDMPQLGYLDVTALTGLQYYNCAKTGIKELDVSFLPELQKLICSYNDIEELDLTHNPKLNCLNCEDNGMKKIDISKCPQLRYFQAGLNKFDKVDIGGCPYLVKTYTQAPRVDEKMGDYDVGYSWTINYGGDDSTGGDSIFYIWLSDETKITMESEAQFPTEERYSDLDSGLKDNDLMNREQVIQFLYEQAGSPDVGNAKSRFNDVEPGSWYEDAVIWGEKNAICMGYPYFLADEFGVGKQITRQDLMFMLMRYSEAMHLERSIDFGRSDDYMDYYEIDYDHWEAVTWCATWHIIEGKGPEGAPKDEQRIDPYGRVTYADFESAFDNMLEINRKDRDVDYSKLRDRKVVLSKSDDSKPADKASDNSAANSQKPQNPKDPGNNDSKKADTDPTSRPDNTSANSSKSESTGTDKSESDVSSKNDPSSKVGTSSSADNKHDDTSKPSDTDKNKSVKGDADLNGSVNVTDIALAASHIKGIKALTGEGYANTDVNNDDQITVTDIAMIASHIKGIKPLK